MATAPAAPPPGSPATTLHRSVLEVPLRRLGANRDEAAVLRLAPAANESRVELAKQSVSVAASFEQRHDLGVLGRIVVRPDERDEGSVARLEKLDPGRR